MAAEPGEPVADPVGDDVPGPILGHGEEPAARFADEFARLATGDGVPRAWAWSLAYVLACDPETHTSAEVAAQMQVSVARVGQVLDFWVRAGLLSRTTGPGQANAYQVNTQIWSAVVDADEPALLLQRYEAFLADQVAGLGNGPGRRRVREALEFCRFLQVEMQTLPERWEEYHRRQAHVQEISDSEPGATSEVIISGSDHIQQVAFSPDGTKLAAGLADGTLHLWGVASRRIIRTLADDGVSQSLAFSPDGTTLAAGSSHLRTWRLRYGIWLPTGTVRVPDLGTVFAMAFRPETGSQSSTLAFTSGNTVHLRDLGAQRTVAILGDIPADRPGWGFLMSIAFAPGGGMLAAGGSDHRIRLWNLTGPVAEPTRPKAPHEPARGRLPWLQRSGRSTSDPHSGASRDSAWTSLTGHTGAVHALAFSPDGTLLASASYDRTVRLWNVASGTTIATLTGHASAVMALAFSPDGRTLASGGADASIDYDTPDDTVRLWDTATGESLAVLAGHTDSVRSLAFSPDGTLLASGSFDKTVRLWRFDQR